nr:lectin-related protein 16.5kD [Pleurotus cornucopiae]
SDAFMLRASPFVGVGGMYATGQGQGNPIIVARLGMQQQLWVEAQPNKIGGDDAVAIFSKDARLTWKFTEPGRPVTLTESEQPSLWYIRRVVKPEDGQEVVQIVAKTDLLGATWYADVGPDNMIVIKSIPVAPPFTPGPVWQKHS